MDTVKVCFDLPMGAFSAFRKSPDEFARYMRIAAAAKWYEMGLVSQEKASEIAGMNREDFLMELSKFKISPFQYSAEEILHESGYEQ